MKTTKIVFLSIILTFLLVKTSFAQCFEDVKFKTHINESNRSIGITFSQELSDIKISLFDVYAQNGNMLLKQKEIKSVASGKEVIVFENLKNSSYLIKIEDGSCVQYIGGTAGINFNK